MQFLLLLFPIYFFPLIMQLLLLYVRSVPNLFFYYFGFHVGDFTVLITVFCWFLAVCNL
jgi:hypothetical protein